MKLYLSSYKLGQKTEVLEDWLKDHDSKIGLIINARDISVGQNSILHIRYLNPKYAMLQQKYPFPIKLK